MGATVTKLRAVLVRSNTIENVATFITAFDDTHQIQRTLKLTTQDWEALGSPEKLTVTVEPGDTLNEEN